MKRRQFIKIGAAAGALTTVGLAGVVAAIQPRRSVWPSLGSGVRSSPKRPRRVAVVGGGLAGISASAVLAQRGYAVDLYEQSDALGGKLAGWPIQVGDETLPMEHGFHGFFKQYYNLRELLSSAGADRHLLPQENYTVLIRDQPAEPFGRASLPFPFDLLEIVGRSPGLDFAHVGGDRPGMLELMSYDPVKTFERWDGIDLDTFIRETKLAGPFADVVMRPFGQASMNALSGFSAAEAIRFFHFYMLGNPEGLGFEALGKGVHISVIEPLTAYLKSLGVRIHTRTRVRHVAIADGRATGVVLSGAPETDDASLALSSVPEHGWVAVGTAGFVRRTATGFEAKSSRCTHMGCPIALASTGGFRCPCHAGQYDGEGRPISGPPPRPLDPLSVEVRGEELFLRATRAMEDQTVPADVVVLAAEVRGLRAIASASDFETHAPDLAASIKASGEAEPYSVIRFWFDRPISESHPAFYTVAGFTWTDGLAAYSSFQESAIDWARRHNGSVIETHAYAIPSELQGDLSTYRDHLLSELLEVFPELKDANIVHEEAMTQSNFTRFGPGDHATRPGVKTEIADLYLAGDHVKLPFPAFLMEAAAASGKLAANHILAEDGVEEAPIPTVALRGQLA
ncbi:MAG: FAD-dependent oxidoreductase [Proteobacteria bacterium]|nr:FAD-dependent oxidoreductase [Pseudomonadota bacterium]